MELNFEDLIVKHANGRAQRVNDKNGNICPVIMFNPRVMVFKISEIANFLYFLLITAEY